MTMTAPLWIFDLDNTLHDAGPHIFPHINRAMTAYLERELGMPEHEASALRLAYWQRYGATLLGLMRHHGTDPCHFLRDTHEFPNLAAMVVTDGALKHALRRLPGEKLVFSNAPMHYVVAVLDVMGIRRSFDAIYAIECTRFQPKPSRAGFRRLLHERGVPPERCIMLEDSLENLKTAKSLGMTTVWVSREARSPGYVDLRIASVAQLPRHLARLM